MKSLTKYLFISLMAMGLCTPLAAQDLADNETCLECHAGEPHAVMENSDHPQIHTEDGGFHVEAHEMWSCVDCHTYIEEIPHADDVTEQAVDCLNCHEEVPQK